MMCTGSHSDVQIALPPTSVKEIETMHSLISPAPSHSGGPIGDVIAFLIGD